MSEFKGTPGPYYVVGEIGRRGQPLGFKPTIRTKTAYDSNEYGCVSVKELETTPQVYLADIRGPGREWGRPSESTEATAKLFAASWDLLKACEAVIATTGGSEAWDGETKEFLLLCEAAIRKATT